MSSRLELVPLDVLTHITFYAVDPAPTSPLDAILALLLSSRHLHHLLCVESCPQLYALIFHHKFDLGGHTRRDNYGTRTTCLASELRARRRVLRRIRLSQVLGQYVLGDLWTTYLMLLESDGLNELQLHDAGVGDWVLRVLGECHSSDTDERVLALAASVACLVLSHNQISSLPLRDRNEVLNVLRPYTTPVHKSSHVQCLWANVSGAVAQEIAVSTSRSQDRGPDRAAVARKISDGGADAYLPLTNYYNRFAIATPDLLTSSVFLTWAFKEVTPLQAPPHLPQTRAIAIATGRHGPTKEDFAAATTRRTPLVADSFLQSQYRESNTDLARERQRPSRSATHDQDFYRIARHMHAPTDAWEDSAYFPGLLTGVWEGSYMIAPLTCKGTSETEDFVGRQPMQVRLEEYVTFTPWQPLPIESHEGFDGYIMRKLTATEEESTRIQFSDGNTEKTFHYEPFRLSGVTESGRNPRHALDVVIAGETPRRFEAAWGSYTFIGRVRLSDGLISLTRKSKLSDDDGSGTWVFEGYLRSRSTLVGHWSSLCGPGQEAIRGIFSMTKTAE